MGTPKGHRRVVLADFKAKKEQEGAIDIELSAGDPIVVPPPAMWSDAVFETLDKNDLTGAATLLVGGAENYQRLVDDGGSAALLFAMLKDEHGVTVGESSASSSS